MKRNLLLFFFMVSVSVMYSQVYQTNEMKTVDKTIPSYVDVIGYNNSDLSGVAKVQKQSNVGDKDFLHDVLKLNDDTEALLTDTLTDVSGGYHKFYTELYKGVIVYGTRYAVHYKNGNVTDLNGNFRTIDNLDVIPSITEKESKESAVAFIGNNSDINVQADFINVKLVVLVKEDVPYLAYCMDFNNISYEPMRIFIDAHSGNVVYVENGAFDVAATGTAETMYYGKQTITTDFNGSTYILFDEKRGVKTRDTAGALYSDSDNKWTTAEFNNVNKGSAALHAHWSIEKSYDFFKNKFGRNGFDNKGGIVTNFVNYPFGDMKDNAGWYISENAIRYGMTSNSEIPVVSLDIAAHEFTHGVTHSTANLSGREEGGALNEGFSDIFAICIEHETLPNKKSGLWVMGDDIFSYRCKRDISAPECKEYKGKGWLYEDDYQNNKDKVHTNCGVLTYWFYLLVNGGELNNYKISSIGWDKATKLCYTTLTAYLNSSSEYADAVKCTMKAAAALFGNNSDEVSQVAMAWLAVGLTPECTISGPDLLKEGETATYTLSGWFSKASIETGGCRVVSNDGKNLVVQAKVNARAYINISCNGKTLASKQLWIGAPIISNIMYDSKNNQLNLNFFGGDPKVTSASWSVSCGGYTFYPYTTYTLNSKEGVINVSVTAANSCGYGPTYSTQLDLNNGGLSLSISSNADTRSIVVRNKDGVDGYANYRLIDCKDGNNVSTGIVSINNGVLDFSKENTGLYILELNSDNSDRCTFKVSLK